MAPRMADPEFSSPAKMQPAWHAPGRFSLPEWRKTAIRFRAKEEVFLVVSSINSDESRAAGFHFPARFAPIFQRHGARSATWDHD